MTRQAELIEGLDFLRAAGTLLNTGHNHEFIQLLKRQDARRTEEILSEVVALAISLQVAVPPLPDQETNEGYKAHAASFGALDEIRLLLNQNDLDDYGEVVRGVKALSRRAEEAERKLAEYEGIGFTWTSRRIGASPAPSPAETVDERMCVCGHGRGLHRAHEWLDEWFDCQYDDGKSIVPCACEQFEPAVASPTREEPDQT